MELNSYSVKLEEIANQKFAGNKSKIIDILNRKNITNILHFTHITNLVSILSEGLKSIYDLKREGIPHHVTDMQRLDEIYQGVCCSMASPNVWMLNNKTGLEIKNYAILEISENTLLLQHFAAFPGNSARTDLKKDAEQSPEKYVGSLGLSRMFLNESLRNEEAVLKYVPTDLQSELIFFNKINADRIRKIHFPGPMIESFMDIYNKIYKDYSHLNIEFECKHNYFYKKNMNQKFDGRRFSLSWDDI